LGAVRRSQYETHTGHEHAPPYRFEHGKYSEFVY
jgi:hypothetical protein